MRTILLHGDKMRRPLIALLLLLAIAGCSKRPEYAAAAFAEKEAASAAAAADGAQHMTSRRYLAYEHSIQIDTEERKVAEIYEAGQAACREAAIDLCTVLESRINTGRDAFASIKFRAKPSGIRKLIAALGKKGEITNQTTNAEDLEAPITDAGKKLEMLKDYRAKLEGLRGHASSNIDALIKVNKELAQVQSELEELTGTHARMMQRVETEILSVDIRADRNQSFWRPVALAMSDFGINFSQGVSIALTSIAYLIPWAFILGMTVWVGRKLWRRRKHVKGNV